MPFDASPPAIKPATPVLNPIVKQQWVDALRSGRYRQISYVCTDQEDGRCVWGVYNEIHHGDALFHKDEAGYLFHSQSAGALANRNDAGESFGSLANWIEDNL